jgi:hypothetical protein
VGWQAAEEEFRREWRERYAPLGWSWEEVKPAFRFGWERARLPGLAHLDWSEVAGDLAKHWYSPQEVDEKMTWDNVRDAVRYGWERARQQASPARHGQSRG